MHAVKRTHTQAQATYLDVSYLAAGNGQVVRRRGDRAQERAAAWLVVIGGHGDADAPPRRRLPDHQAARPRGQSLEAERGSAPHEPAVGGVRRHARVQVLGVE